VNTLVTAVAALLGLLLAVLIGPLAVVAAGLLGAIRMVAAIAAGVRGRVRPVVVDNSARSTPASGRDVVDPVPETTSGDVLDHAHVRIGRVR
jgi:hypothetical protein